MNLSLLPWTCSRNRPSREPGQIIWDGFTPRQIKRVLYSSEEMQASLLFKAKQLEPGQFRNAIQHSIETVFSPKAIIVVSYPHEPADGITDAIASDLSSLDLLVSLDDVDVTVSATTKDQSGYTEKSVTFVFKTHSYGFAAYAYDDLSVKVLQAAVVALTGSGSADRADKES